MFPAGRGRDAAGREARGAAQRLRSFAEKPRKARAEVFLLAKMEGEISPSAPDPSYAAKAKRKGQSEFNT